MLECFNCNLNEILSYIQLLYNKRKWNIIFLFQTLRQQNLPREAIAPFMSKQTAHFAKRIKMSKDKNYEVQKQIRCQVKVTVKIMMKLYNFGNKRNKTIIVLGNNCKIGATSLIFPGLFSVTILMASARTSDHNMMEDICESGCQLWKRHFHFGSFLESKGNKPLSH